MDFLAKIQKSPEPTRKIILWSVVVILGLVLFILWLKTVQKTLKSFPAEDFKKQLQIPQLKENLKSLPKIEIPEIEIPEISQQEWEEMKKGLSEEEIKDLEKIFKVKPQ